jgi:hypothetical protein
MQRRLARGISKEAIDDDQHNRYLQRQRTRKRKQQMSGRGKGRGRGRGYGSPRYGSKGRGKGRHRAYAVLQTECPPYEEPKPSESEEDMDNLDGEQTEEPEI